MSSASSLSASFAIVIQALQQVLQSELIIAAFVIAIGLLFFCIFVIGTFVAVYVLSFLWARYESRNQKTAAVDAFDYGALVTELAILGTPLWTALAALGTFAIDLVQSVGSAIVNNPLQLLLFLGVFLLTIPWDTFHNVIIQSLNAPYTCFVAPVSRILFLPILNLTALAAIIPLPLLNATREIWVSITSTTLIETVLCGSQELLAFIEGLVFTVFGSPGDASNSIPAQTGLVFALIDWITGANGSPIAVGIDFFSAGQILGATIASLGNFATCLCAPIAAPIIEPLLVPFNTPFFAQAFNASLNSFPPLPIVFLTQGLSLWAVRTAQNLLTPNFTGGFGAAFVRPSFNSTFDVLESLVVNVAEFSDTYAISLFNITANIVQEIESACPTHTPYANQALCNNDDTVNNGTCSLGTCVAQFISPVGCCKSDAGLCVSAIALSTCDLSPGSTFFEGFQCAQVAGCTTATGCCASLFDKTTQVAALCKDDVSATSCSAATDQFSVGLPCAFVPQLNCTTQTALATVVTTPLACSGPSSCSGTGVCGCENCLCRYSVSLRPAVANTKPITAFADCVSATEVGTPGAADACRVPLPNLPTPPVPGLITGVVFLTLDGSAIQPLKFIFNILFQIDVVLGSLNGFLLFRIDDTIGQAFINGTNAIAAVPFWLQELTIAIGDIIANDTADGQLASQSPVVRRMPGMTLAVRRELDKVFSTESDLIRLGFSVIATIFQVIGLLLQSIGFALIGTLEFVLNQSFGAIYFAIATGIQNGFPDVFAFAKDSFGGALVPTNAPFICVVPGTTLGQTTELFTAFVSDVNAVTCSEEVELLNFCRFVFQRAIATGTSSTNVTDQQPNYITLIDQTPDIVTRVQTCVFSIQNCFPAVVPLHPPPAESIAVNEFQVLLELYVAIFAAFDPLVSVWCGNCSQLGHFVSGFAQPLVPILLVPIEAIVFIGNIVASPFIVCLDVDTAIQAVSQFVTNFTNLFRLINEGVTGHACIVGVGARDSDILCAIAQAFDSAITVLSNIILFVWHIIQGLVYVITDIYPPETVLSTFTFNTVKVPLQDFTFAVLAIVFQIIPQSVICVPLINENVGCCLIPFDINGISDTLCIAQQTNASCVTFVNTIFSPSFILPGITVLPNVTCLTTNPAVCAQELPVPGRPADESIPLAYGCCKTLPLSVQPGQALVATSCKDQALGRLECLGNNADFFINQACADAPGPTCPLIQGPVQAVVAQALAVVLVDLLLLLPQIAVQFVISLAQLLVELSEDAFANLISSLFEPIFETAADAFRQLALIAGCAGSPAIQAAFSVIATFIETELCLIVQIVVDLVLFVVFIVFGIIQVLTTFQFTILAQAGQFFLDLVLAFAFAVLTVPFTCGFQGFLCDLNAGNDDSVNFAVNQCRTFICCTNPGTTQLVTCLTDSGLCDSTLDCMFACSCDITNPITDCSQASCQGQCAGGASPSRANPFAEILASARNTERLLQLSAENVRHGTSAVAGGAPPAVLSPEFCGAYVAVMGIEQARKEPSTSVAAQCLGAIVRRPVTLRTLIADEYAQLSAEIGVVRKSLSARWDDIHAQADKIDPDVPLDSQFSRLLYDVHGVQRQRFSKRSFTERLAYVKARKSLWRTHSADLGNSFFVNWVHASKMMQKALDSGQHTYLGDWLSAHFSKPEDTPARMANRVVPNPPFIHHLIGRPGGRVVLERSRINAVALQVAIDAAQRYGARVGQRINRRVAELIDNLRPGKNMELKQQMRSMAVQQALSNLRLSGLLPYRQKRFGVQHEYHMSVDALVDNKTLNILGALACNESTQSICTGCLVLDNLIFASEDAVNNLKTFYPNNQTGFLSYVAISEAGFNNTIVDPIGTDTFTTENKAVPWLFDQLTTVNWFFLWNYTQLIDIVSQSGSSSSSLNMYVGQTVVLQNQRAAAVGRVDFDNNVLALFGEILISPITIGEQVVGAIGGSAAFNVLGQIYTTYIQCDYNGALQCLSPLGIGLFDAIANTVVFAIIAIFVVNLIISGAGTSVFLIILGISYFIILWMAYGASPLCTTTSLVPVPFLMVGIPGVPNCLPIDIYTLVSEFFPQCFPIPVSLILPSAVAEASVTLCAACGDAPPLNNCAAAAGFLNGFDNFFYITGSLLPPEFNQFIASAIAIVSPVISEVAALYTPAYIKALGEVGAVCNIILLPNLLSAGLLVVLIAALLFVVIGPLIFLDVIVFWLLFVTIIVGGFMLVQIDEGFVQGTRVEKLKLKEE